MFSEISVTWIKTQEWCHPESKMGILFSGLKNGPKWHVLNFFSKNLESKNSLSFRYGESNCFLKYKNVNVKLWFGLNYERKQPLYLHKISNNKN